MTTDMSPVLLNHDAAAAAATAWIPGAHVLAGQKGAVGIMARASERALRVNQSLIFAPSDGPGAADLAIARDSSRTCSVCIRTPERQDTEFSERWAKTRFSLS